MSWHLLPTLKWAVNWILKQEICKTSPATKRTVCRDVLAAVIQLYMEAFCDASPTLLTPALLLPVVFFQVDLLPK